MPKRNAKAELSIEIPPFLMGTDKRTTILRAAMICFLRDGFSETSMDAITEEAGVSKATVYAHFASKQILFESFILEASSSTIAQFPPLLRSGGPPEQELLAFFEPVIDHIVSAVGYSWDRLVIAEAARHPDIAKHFYRCTIDRMNVMVDHYILALQAEGIFRPVEARTATNALLSMVLIGPLHTRLLIGREGVDLRASLRFSIQLFLDGMSHR